MNDDQAVEQLTKIRIAVQWIALLTLTIAVMVGLMAFGVVDVGITADL